MNWNQGTFGSAAAALILLLVACDPGSSPAPGKGADQRYGTAPQADKDLEDYLAFFAKRKCPGDLDKGSLGLLKRVCEESVPRDGRVWIEDDEGHSCYCECEELQGLTVKQMEAARANARLKEIKKYLSRRGHILTSEKLHPKADIKGLDTTVLDTSKLFDGHVRMQSISLRSSVSGLLATRTAAFEAVVEDFYEAYPIFMASIVPGGGYNYPWCRDEDRPRTALWDPGTGELPDDMKMIIEFPRSLIRHPAVGPELMAFFLAHEIGHSQGPVRDCMAPVGTDPAIQVVCEADCDHWGTMIALNAVYSGAEYLRVVKRAIAQFQAYTAAVGDDGACGQIPWAICDLVGCSCGYPPSNGRVQAMKAARNLRPVPPTVADWYNTEPPSCRTAGDGCPTIAATGTP